ncbi:MAG: hypothetical protein WB998_12605 [Solirubrobacteraceae bacterium]
MIATPHMLVGAACASRARTVGGALAIGALTHLLLDAIPHRDYRLDASGGLVLGTDMAAGTLSAVCLSRGSRVRLAGAVGGVLPDVLALAERALGRSPVGTAHATAHTDSRPSPLLSASIQGLVAVAGAVALAKASSGRGVPKTPGDDASLPNSKARFQSASSLSLRPTPGISNRW